MSVTTVQHEERIDSERRPYLLSRAVASCFNAISTLDHVGFQADRTRSAM